jgi:chemotaxis protein methyltransferase WspC
VQPPAPAPATSARLPAPAEPPRPDLAAAEALANQGRLGEAAALCETLLARGPAAPAYQLLGLIRLGQRRDEDAEVCFQRVLYLEPNHREALLHLALLADKRADQRAAANYRRRAGVIDGAKEHL